VDAAGLKAALTTYVGPDLAPDLVDEFLKIRRDYATKTLERAGLGKFVETYVQCLQFLATGAFDAHPSVDAYLDQQAGQQTSLPEGLRIVGARVARSIYTLRNKRNILHKNPIDPSLADLAFAHEGAAWIMAEFLRNSSAVSMDEARRLIDMVEAPVRHFVEEIDGTRLVHGNLTVGEEILVLLHSYDPVAVTKETIGGSLSRRSFKSVANRLSDLDKGKLIQKTGVGYRLTIPGHAAAVEAIKKLT
jgi:hypothetical protein